MRFPTSRQAMFKTVKDRRWGIRWSKDRTNKSCKINLYFNCPSCCRNQQVPISVCKKTDFKIRCEDCPLVLGRAVINGDSSEEDPYKGLQTYQMACSLPPTLAGSSMDIGSRSSVGAFDQLSQECQRLAGAARRDDDLEILVRGATGAGNTSTEADTTTQNALGQTSDLPNSDTAPTAHNQRKKTNSSTQTSSGYRDESVIAQRGPMRFFASVKRYARSLRMPFLRQRSFPSQKTGSDDLGEDSAPVLSLQRHPQLPQTITVRCLCDRNCPCHGNKQENWQSRAALGSTYAYSSYPISEPSSSSHPYVSNVVRRISSPQPPGSSGSGTNKAVAPSLQGHITWESNSARSSPENSPRRGMLPNHGTPGIHERVLFPPEQVRVDTRGRRGMRFAQRFPKTW